MWPPSRHACGLLFVLALAGCSREQSPAPVVVPALPMAAALPDDELSLILPELMDLLVDPAAGVLLAAAGQTAHHEGEPRSVEAWQAVVDAAAQLAQTSSMLGDPALARGRPDWQAWVEAMRDGAAAGSAAARRRDPRGLYAAGQQLKAACDGCHARQARQLAEPLALQAPR